MAKLQFSNVFGAGQTSLDLRVARRAGKYSCQLLKEGKPLKLSLEKINEHKMTQALMHYYFFRDSEKEYSGHRHLLARLAGVHKKGPLEMAYVEQKYVLSFKQKLEGESLELQLFYSPSLGHIVIRGSRA